MRMPFGKYGPSAKHPKGISLEFIPSGYFRYLLKQDWFLKKYDSLAADIEKELKIRDQNDAHFDDDKVGVDM